MSDEKASSSGVGGAVKAALDTGLAIAQNRIELVALELRDEKRRLVEAMVWAAAIVALGAASLSAATLAVLFLCAESVRGVVLAALSAAYLGGTIWAFFALKSRLKSHTPLADTVNEIKRDRACLGGGS
jgi:uncharacterized membrane protein YqjE